MADGIITFVDGVAMFITPDGQGYRWADVQRHNNPDMDFDDITGTPLPSTPTAYDPAADLSVPQRSLGSRVGNEDLAAGRALALDPDASMYSLLDPEGRYADTPIGYFNQALMRAPDLALGGLLAMFGGAQKAAGYGSDLLGLGLQPGDIPNSEEAFQVADALYALPTARMAGAVSGAASRSAADTGRRFIADETGSIPLGRPLPAPRNEAEAMARNILEMRAAGRAGDVTEEMRAAADPMYMYQNTPLPMDEASRMARADQYWPDDAYHATGSDFFAFDPLKRGTATDSGWFGDAEYFSPKPEYAAKFAPVTTDSANIIPVRLNRGSVYDWRAMEADRGGRGVGNNRDASLAARARLEGEGFDSVEVSNSILRGDITDELWAAMVAADPQVEAFGRDNVARSFGAGIPKDSLKPYFNKEMLDLVPVQRDVEEIAIFDPRNIRSRFALFDPEFRHLRNLSAGIGGLGLLSLPQDEEMQ